MYFKGQLFGNMESKIDSYVKNWSFENLASRYIRLCNEEGYEGRNVKAISKRSLAISLVDIERIRYERLEEEEEQRVIETYRKIKRKINSFKSNFGILIFPITLIIAFFLSLLTL
tara:strand:- start:156 stop:500 length:345 start_codon:yes stop_codon:yes gene_type:complete